MPVVNVYTSVTSENVSHSELLVWSNLVKVEDMASGAAYCQLTDILFPKHVPLTNINWNSRKEVDWITNWEILETCWKDIGIDKKIPIESLMSAKFEDNFEFFHWFKKFFDANYDGHKYDPIAARNNQPLGNFSDDEIVSENEKKTPEMIAVSSPSDQLMSPCTRTLEKSRFEVGPKFKLDKND
uniref:Calponin-homology (CH) domain-containing protein n=1 Tax=Meloidogyne javanica TaxID=6303 RepID=A0A915MEJ4_MELJA